MKSKQMLSTDLEKHFSTQVLSHKKKVKNYYGKYINLSSNELHHPKIDELSRKVTKLISGKFNEYPYYPYHTNVIANFYSLKEDQVLLSPGSDNVIKLILMSIALSHKRVILQMPNYYNYYNYAKMFGINLTEVHSYPEDSGSSFLKSLEYSILAEQPSLIIITNPSAIKGSFISLNEIEKVIVLAQKNGHLVLIDEAYIEFSEKNHLNFIDRYDNVLIVRTMSKFPGIAGLRLAILAGNSKLINELMKFNPQNGVSSLTLELFQEIFKEKELLDQLREETKHTRTAMSGSLHTLFPNIKVYESHTNFLMINCFNQSFCLNLIRLLKDNGIIVKHLGNIMGYEACLRITVGTKIETNKMIKILHNNKLKLLDDLAK